MLFGLRFREPPKEKVELPVIGPFGAGGEEPKLAELLDDPIIHMVARSDNVAPEELAGCVQEFRKRYGTKN